MHLALIIIQFKAGLYPPALAPPGLGRGRKDWLQHEWKRGCDQIFIYDSVDLH